MAATKATIPALQLITSGAHPAKPIISLNVSGLFSEYVCPLFIVGDSARCMAESMSTMSDDDDDVVGESISSIDAVFFTINHFLRPARLALGIYLAPKMLKVLEGVEGKLGVNRGVSTGIVILLFNIILTLGVMGGGVMLAGVVSGVPVFK